MDVYEGPEPRRKPDRTAAVMSGSYTVHGRRVTLVELREYVQAGAPGRRSLITAFLRMDGHTVEMAYDTGRGDGDALRDAASFLVSMLGVSPLVLRAHLALQERMAGDGPD